MAFSPSPARPRLESGLALLVDGRWDETTLALDRHNARWPRDILALQAGYRWGELASAWEAHADGRSYPFNDWHAVMA